MAEQMIDTTIGTILNSVTTEPAINAVVSAPVLFKEANIIIGPIHIMKMKNAQEIKTAMIRCRRAMFLFFCYPMDQS